MVPFDSITKVNKWLVCFSARVLGGVGDEQRCSWLSPVALHRRPSVWPAASPSGGGGGGHGRGAGARAVLIFDPQWRHGEDPVGCPARVESQQLLMWQVKLRYSVPADHFIAEPHSPPLKYRWRHEIFHRNRKLQRKSQGLGIIRACVYGCGRLFHVVKSAWLSLTLEQCLFQETSLLKPKQNHLITTLERSLFVNKSEFDTLPAPLFPWRL